MKLSVVYYLCASSLLLTACNKQDLPETNRPQYAVEAIAFTTPYTADELETRSFAMRESFQEGDKVGVLGFCEASSNGTDYGTSPWDTKKPFATPDIFYNQMLECKGAGSWDYTWNGTGNISGLHPWLENEAYTYAFFAYYPYATIEDGKNSGIIDGTGIVADEDDNRRYGLGTITLSEKDHRGDPTITYTMPHHPAKYNSTLNWWYVPDFMLAYKTDHLKSMGSVKLNFRHLFCSFEFRINNYNDHPVTIEDFYIWGGNGTKDQNPTTGFYKSVSVTGQESGYSVSDDFYFGRFKLVGRKEGEDEHILMSIDCPSATVDSDGNLTPGTAIISYKESPISLLFIPDHNGKLTTDNNEDIRLELTVTQDGNKLFDTDPRSMNLEDVYFEPGVRSIFNINIVGNDFTLQMESDGRWEDGGDSDIVFE